MKRMLLLCTALPFIAVAPAFAEDKSQAAAQQKGMAPTHERSGTEDMTRAVPPMKPGDPPSGSEKGAAGWTSDGKLRSTGAAGAVEDEKKSK